MENFSNDRPEILDRRQFLSGALAAAALSVSGCQENKTKRDDLLDSAAKGVTPESRNKAFQELIQNYGLRKEELRNFVFNGVDYSIRLKSFEKLSNIYVLSKNEAFDIALHQQDKDIREKAYNYLMVNFKLSENEIKEFSKSNLNIDHKTVESKPLAVKNEKKDNLQAYGEISLLLAAAIGTFRWAIKKIHAMKYEDDNLSSSADQDKVIPSQLESEIMHKRMQQISGVNLNQSFDTEKAVNDNRNRAA